LNHRVVVTGLGLVAPNGSTVDKSWKNIKEGVSGIAPIESFDASGFATTIAGEIKDFNVADYDISVKDARKMDPFIHYGLAAAIQAIQDSGLEVSESNCKRIGTIIGSGIGGLPGIEKGYQSFVDGGPRRISPFFVPSNIINMVSGHLSIRYGIRGANYAVVSACSTGAHCIGLAARTIERGEQDAIIAGGAEYSTCPTGIGGFASAKALSTRNDDPSSASRPWDLERDGFVLSDGAGVVMLESLEHAESRGAEIYAELIGFGMNSDAHHMTAPAPNGAGAADCMRLAIEDAKINPEDVSYINAHGTSTPAGDLAETQAVKSVFGDHAYDLVMSSTKSMVGHMLGAAGGAEAIYSILALKQQIAPPTINLENPDPDCDLDYVANSARDMPIKVALSNSFGFGGTNGTLVFRAL
jgi:3-oxoacyl-[acyl-carrier-protein] synthase II